VTWRRGISRRGTLRLLALLAMGPAHVARSLAAEPRTLQAVAQHPLARRLGQPAAIARVGRNYARRVPSEADAAILRRLLELPARDWDGDSAAARAWAASFLVRHRRDFRDGRTEHVRGWMLSASELRLFALIWLEASAAAHPR